MVKLLLNQFKSLRKVHKGLLKKYEGLFPIVERVGKATNKVQLPSKLKIHNIFHVNMLKPFTKIKMTPSEDSPREPQSA